jgi:hypothetical protein
MANKLWFMATAIAASIHLNLTGGAIDWILLISEFNHEWNMSLFISHVWNWLFYLIVSALAYMTCAMRPLEVNRFMSLPSQSLLWLSKLYQSARPSLLIIVDQSWCSWIHLHLMVNWYELWLFILESASWLKVRTYMIKPSNFLYLGVLCMFLSWLNVHYKICHNPRSCLPWFIHD